MTARTIAVIAALVGGGWAAGRLSVTASFDAREGALARDARQDARAREERPMGATDPYALLVDLRAARGVPDLAGQSGALSAVAARWRGRAVRWHVLVPRALCRSADACHAVPFDHADGRAAALAPILEGWLPRLSLDAAAMARLDACGDACSVDIEGTITGVTASTELPTAVAIDVVAITAAGPPRPSERWMR